MGSDYAEAPPMEVEEVLHGDSPTDSDARSVISENDKPPAPTRWPKAPPRRYCLGGTQPGTLAPVPKTHRGRKEAIPMPTPETGKVASAPPVAEQKRLPPPKSARGDSPQVSWAAAQPTTGEQPGALAGLAGLTILLNDVVPVTLFVPVVLSPLVSVPVCCRFGACPSPLCLARAGSCQVVQSPGLAVRHWSRGHGPIG
ncbi:hypothetical protein P4O66_006950 [Electrophorus voltai]|uniref:Uncharacterized protein n=1 Tax=Electrophorus voltai TaxID=2609070 RepID=A0AAD9DZH5_9TELE|nr:hypothetical protein P4O66_006950 [Electrophorus voltai]